jgi:sulfatase modifying factor 1
MMKRISGVIIIVLVMIMSIFVSSCAKEKSSVTGWGYNDKKWGGFEKKDYAGQETGPGLVLVEGGTFVMGNTEQDVLYEHNNISRRATVSSFYMDETEISNSQYREYLYWLDRTYGIDYPSVLRKATPDTLVWRDELAYNEPYVEYYLRHPAFQDYPVVGVNWLQATDFCAWRTDRVNEMILIREGVLELNMNQVNEDNFNTEAYLIGQYEGMVKKNLVDLNPQGSGTRKVRMEDGILLPIYRLPTEAEWEFAAKGLIGNLPYKDEERFSDQRIYPWNGTSTRYPKFGSWQGDFLANFKRGGGDNMGLAGNLNDNADITALVKSFYPNDYGLYNMSGNVSEWVMDVYRPMTTYDMNDFRSFRGNVYKTTVLDPEGVPIEKDSLGHLVKRVVTADENANRRNYKKGDVINFTDGDDNSWTKYAYGASSLVDDKARVYKGGSWKDRAYFISPGSRRFLDQEQSTDAIGFRCCMDRLGAPAGNDSKAGNFFKGGTKGRKK